METVSMSNASAAEQVAATRQWVEANRSRPPFSRPQYLKVETTNVCNADCAFCTYGRMTRPKATMSTDLYRKVIDEYVEAGGGALTLSPLVGDCFCDRHFLDRLRYCRTHDEITHVGFHTNLIALDRFSEDELVEILDLIDVFNCSIGPNRAEPSRPGAAKLDARPAPSGRDRPQQTGERVTR
jgi:MoaA/NifB/PqqE/SkfB family radical SAM enzyme